MKVQTGIRAVRIDLVARQKWDHWVALAKGEVGALGLVEDTDDGPVVTDLFLVKQVCTQASTDLDPDDVARLMVEMEAEGRADQLRAWFHSHGTLNVFWSGTDDRTIAGFCSDLPFVSIVTNKRGEVRARVDLFQPVRITLDELPVEVRLPDPCMEEECRLEFIEKVTEKTAMVLPGPGTGMPFSDPMAALDPWQMGLFDIDRRYVPGHVDLDELEMAVRRGEVSLEEYLAVADREDALMQGVTPFDGVEEVRHGRRP